MSTIAIIGGGPRGLSGLENIFKTLRDRNLPLDIKVMLFESTPYVGHGWVYAPNQLDTNLLNISERALALVKREQLTWSSLLLPEFPSYHNWIKGKQKKIANSHDHFPPRSKLGRYLKERYESIATVLIKNKLLEVHQSTVIKLEHQRQKIILTTSDNNTLAVNQALLTIGHQETKTSTQLQKWQKHVKVNGALSLFKNPYPVQNIISTNSIGSKDIVGLRGFGLAMIDVTRAITINLGGEFKVIDESTLKMKYIPSPRCPKLIVPFSLDGLPMAPKPINLEIDNWFKPTEKSIQTLTECITSFASGQKATDDIHFLIEAISEIAAAVYTRLNEKARMHRLSPFNLKEIIVSWLKDSNIEHPLIVSKNQESQTVMKAFVDMATGNNSVSLDYCIGQVWRYCQPTFYKELSYSKLSNDIIAQIISLDERMKRYAYGPPVASIQQLLALIEAGKMTLKKVEDPNIKMISSGWKLGVNDDAIIANIMINTVLDSPKLLKVASPLIKQLLADDVIQPIHDKLGTHTDENGFILSNNSDHKVSLAMLGRLTKGTVIGVDAILECFGERSEKWAKEAVSRHLSQS